jgi:signal transduction histidine kinase
MKQSCLGTALGLAISGRLERMMRGDVTVAVRLPGSAKS